jgi:hypothetical protein
VAVRAWSHEYFGGIDLVKSLPDFRLRDDSTPRSACPGAPGNQASGVGAGQLPGGIVNMLVPEDANAHADDRGAASGGSRPTVRLLPPAMAVCMANIMGFLRSSMDGSAAVTD